MRVDWGFRLNADQIGVPIPVKIASPEDPAVPGVGIGEEVHGHKLAVAGAQKRRPAECEIGLLVVVEIRHCDPGGVAQDEVIRFR